MSNYIKIWVILAVGSLIALAWREVGRLYIERDVARWELQAREDAVLSVASEARAVAKGGCK